jgi:hypothetical protein
MQIACMFYLSDDLLLATSMSFWLCRLLDFLIKALRYASLRYSSGLIPLILLIFVAFASLSCSLAGGVQVRLGSKG